MKMSENHCWESVNCDNQFCEFWPHFVSNMEMLDKSSLEVKYPLIESRMEEA